LAAQKPQGKPVLRWSTLKGAAALVMFIVLAALVEGLIIVYAISIGVRDEAGFKIPWLGLTVSPLFHLVPISVIIVLAASWTCMVKYIATKPEKVKQPAKKMKASEKKAIGLKSRISGFLGRVKARLLKIKGVSYIGSRMSFARAAVKSAVTILLVFLALALLFSVLANPWLVYGTFANLYRNNPQILGFVVAVNSALQGFAEAVAPVGWLCSSIDSAIRSAAPSFRGFISALGALTKPLADLPPAGKYLVFQNLAAWLSALAVLGYGAYTRKSYRFKRK
jgi:hypothetical protein